MRNIFEILTYRLPSKFLLQFQDKDFILRLSKKMGCTYVSLIKLKERLVDEGIITKERKGRTDLLYLTEKGRLIKGELFKIDNFMGD